MDTLKYLIVLSLINFLYSEQCSKCPGVECYEKESGQKTRLTTLQEGNYTIQALIAFTNISSKCSKVTHSGLVRTYALKYAIDKFNRNSTYSKVAKLGLQLDDVCAQLPVTMARGIEVVSFHRPNSVCRADFLKCDAKPRTVTIQEASAVVGTAMSFTTIPLASLMSLYSIPQVSFSASSRLLSKKDLYKSFFRTIPSDTNQIVVMLDIFRKFKWNYIFAVGSDDDYGKLGVSSLKQEAQQQQVCIYRDEYVPYQSTKTQSKVEDVVKKIKAEPKAKVVVLFCYVAGLGDLILEEAKKQGVERIWLTSEAWNPAAIATFQNKQHLLNVTHGLLTVSLQRWPMKYFVDYMKTEIRDDWKCNAWLKNYLNDAHNCKIKAFDNDVFSGTNSTGDACKLTLTTIMKDLSNLPGNIDRLIDATTSLGIAMHRVLEKNCTQEKYQSGNCHLLKLSTDLITKEMFNVNFTNEQGHMISFNSMGDPEVAYYTVENLVYNKDTKTYEYVKVGDWNDRLVSKKLELNASAIKWPYWFNKTRKETYSNRYVPSEFPASRCSDECEPGQYVVGKSGCCWSCQKCQGNNHTSKRMMPKCVPCGDYWHTLDNKKCIETPILWMEISDPAGMSIVIISVIGLLGLAATSFVIWKYNKMVVLHEASPHMVTFVCVLLLATFIYGPMHIIEPTNILCQIRNSYFFVLLMIYAAYTLIKTQAVGVYLKSHAEKSFGGSLLSTQLLVLFMLFLLEVVSVVAWLYVDGLQLKEFRDDVAHKIWKQCEVEFTAARLVSTFIPCIILIIATFCAFRERNGEHSFYEPKFLSFSCIALCIIIVAFLPTFKYVVGIYKAIVLAFTMNVFGYTFMACIILPKVYVGIMRNRRGINEYPMKPGTAKQDDGNDDGKEKKKKVDKTYSEELTETTVTKSSAQKDSIKSAVVDRQEETIYTDINSVNGEQKPDAVENGYSNESFDVHDVEYADPSYCTIEDPSYCTIEDPSSPPPNYENIKDTVDNTKC